jgi:hypothetical protein
MMTEVNQFTLDESRLALVAGRYEIGTDHDALLALEAVILGDGDGGPLLAGPCEIAVDLLADQDGELDGYRVILHPDAGEAAPWLASGIQRVSYHRDDGRGTAEIIRDFARVANSLLAWHQERGQATAVEAFRPPLASSASRDAGELVLRMWGSPPGLDGRPATIDALPMLRQADGSLTGPSWDGSEPAGAVALRSLVLTADAAPDGTLTRWRAQYRPHGVVDEGRAGGMHRTLSHLRASLDRAAALDGPPAGFEGYLARAASALGIAAAAPFAVYVPARQGGPQWRYLGTAELAGWLPSQARLVSGPAARSAEQPAK